MKKVLILLFLLAGCASAPKEDDGSITLTKDQKQAVEAMVNQLLHDRMRLTLENGGMSEALRELQQRHMDLEKAKCI